MVEVCRITPTLSCPPAGKATDRHRCGATFAVGCMDVCTSGIFALPCKQEIFQRARGHRIRSSAVTRHLVDLQRLSDFAVCSFAFAWRTCLERLSQTESFSTYHPPKFKVGTFFPRFFKNKQQQNKLLYSLSSQTTNLHTIPSMISANK